MSLAHDFWNAMSLFAVNFHAFNFDLEEVWGHFKIALETSYSKMPSNFLWLKIKGLKIVCSHCLVDFIQDSCQSIILIAAGEFSLKWPSVRKMRAAFQRMHDFEPKL